MLRFLIDECLTPHLVRAAHSAGFEAYHVAHRGWSSWTDRQLFRTVLDENLVVVTNNRADFLGLVRGTDLHPGLVVVVENVRRARQVELFRAALGVIVRDLVAGRDMVNSVVEVSADAVVTRFELPPLGE